MVEREKRENRDREKGDKRELSYRIEEEDKEHRHLPLLVSSRHCEWSCSVKGLAEETSEVLIRTDVVGVAKVANN